MTAVHPLLPTVQPPQVASTASPGPGVAAPGRRWAGFGVLAAVAAAVALGAEGALTAYYDPAVAGDAARVAADVADHKAALTVFHAAGAGCAVLLIPFAAGLQRRLRVALGATSSLPAVAGFGVLVTSMVMVMGTALDTDLAIFVPPADGIPPEHVSFYAHWTGSVPSLWTAAGVTGLALFAAWRRGAVSRAQGLTGLLLGGLAAGLGVSPLEYMSVIPGVLWLLVASAMFLLGDRARLQA
jgi:hypothetical protein